MPMNNLNEIAIKNAGQVMGYEDAAYLKLTTQAMPLTNKLFLYAVIST
jgi:hypothetical protein